MAMEITGPGENAPLTPREKLLRTSQLVTALTAMALSRGADPSGKTLELFAERLSQLPDQASVDAVIAEYGDTPQAEREKAFPDYGTLLLLIEDRTHPLRVLRTAVRVLANNYGVVVTPALIQSFESYVGHRTDEDIEKALTDIMKFRESTRMPTTAEFLRACGIPKVYRNGSKPE
jgi:hypothetical protein